MPRPRHGSAATTSTSSSGSRRPTSGRGRVLSGSCSWARPRAVRPPHRCAARCRVINHIPGKSTTLKSMCLLFAVGRCTALTSCDADFQMMYGSAKWKAERASWRSVIQLNLIHSVNIVLDALSKHLSKRSPHPSVQGLSSNYLPSPVSPAEQLPFRRNGAIPFGPLQVQVSASSATSPTDDGTPRFDDSHRALRLRLAPLRRVEADLCSRLGITTDDPNTAIVFPFGPPSPLSPDASSITPDRLKEASVRSWKGALFSPAGPFRSMRGGRTTESESDDTTDVLVMCREDIKTLWRDAGVQLMLVKEEIKLEAAPGLCVLCLGFWIDAEPLLTRGAAFSTVWTGSRITRMSRQTTT